jgi:ribosomal protein S8
VLTDPIADLLVRISNGYRARHRFIDVRGSQLRKGVLSVLKTHGFVEDYLEKTEQGKVSLRVKLKYGVCGGQWDGAIFHACGVVWVSLCCQRLVG